MKKKRKILNFVILACVISYVAITFINQHKILNQYEKNCADLTAQIKEEKEYKGELSKKMENVSSKEFIEDAARKNIDMYLPNEKVYLDAGF